MVECVHTINVFYAPPVCQALPLALQSTWDPDRYNPCSRDGRLTVSPPGTQVLPPSWSFKEARK